MIFNLKDPKFEGIVYIYKLIHGHIFIKGYIKNANVEISYLFQSADC